MTNMPLEEYAKALAGIETFRWSGRVKEMVGLLVASEGPAAGMGDFCEIQSSGGRRVRSQVVGFRDERVLLMPLEETGGLQPGDVVTARPADAKFDAGPELLGRVLDGFGQPMDGGPPIRGEERRTPAPGPGEVLVRIKSAGI